MRKNSISFSRVSKAILVLFSLAFFLLAPFIDNIACKDCASPFQGNGPDDPHLCSFCFNNFGAVLGHSFNILLVSSPLSIEKAMVAFSGPVPPINNPHQN